MDAARLPERLTVTEAGPVLAGLRRTLAAQAGDRVALDAGALRHFDSSALALLLELRRELQRGGRELQVLNWPARLRDLVAAYGVAELFPA